MYALRGTELNIRRYDGHGGWYFDDEFVLDSRRTDQQARDDTSVMTLKTQDLRPMSERERAFYATEDGLGAFIKILSTYTVTLIDHGDGWLCEIELWDDYADGEGSTRAEALRSAQRAFANIRRYSPYERTKAAVYATGNRWAIENFEATH